MFKQTGVDGIMIGRAAIGNPWIFRQVQDYLKNYENNDDIEKNNKQNLLKLQSISNEERLEIMLEHIELQVKELGENTGIKEMRKYMTYYLKNLKNASSIRQKINQIETKDELIACLTEYFKNL